MASSGLADCLLIFATIVVTIALLGGTFLLILCAPRIRFGRGVVLAGIACIALALGAWSAILHGLVRINPPTDGARDATEPDVAPDFPAPPVQRREDEIRDGQFH